MIVAFAVKMQRSLHSLPFQKPKHSHGPFQHHRLTSSVYLHDYHQQHYASGQCRQQINTIVKRCPWVVICQITWFAVTVRGRYYVYSYTYDKSYYAILGEVQ